MKKGIDISFWQEAVDFASLKNSGVEFIIPRTGYSKTTDSRFAEYVKGAKAVGIDIPAVYHFSYALTVAEAQQEAVYAVDRVRDAGLPSHTVIFYDFEYDSVAYMRKKGVTPNAALANSFARAFCETVESAGYKAGIYVNIDYYLNWITDRDLYSKYYFWLADLNGDPDYDCDVHQYSFRAPYANRTFDGDKWLKRYPSELPAEQKTSSAITAEQVLNVARKYVDTTPRESSNYDHILSVYNGHKPLARGYAIQKTDAWCDCFVSAVAIEAGAVDLIGTEVSCEKHIDIFESKGIWNEDGSIIPEPGDIILYNWDDGTQPNDGVADHIGYVESVDGSTITVIEGNYHNEVARRQVQIGWGYIRGYAKPKYAKTERQSTNRKVYTTDELVEQILLGVWGNGVDRKNRLLAAGYDYDAVQAAVTERILGGQPSKTIDEVAQEVIAGKWGNGEDRRAKLTAAGYNYDVVQSRVNALFNSQDIDRLAKEVIAGKYGNGDARKKALGDKYQSVQKRVNEMLV